MRKFAIAATVAVLGLMAPPASAESYNLTVAGASPGGLWSLLGAGLDAAVKAAHPGSTVTYQTSGGGLANVAVLQRKDADMGIVHDAELQVAKQGSAPFSEPVEDLRVLSYLYTWAPMQPVIRADFAKEHGIDTFADLAARQVPVRVAINKRGNIASEVALAMLEAIGAGPDEIEAWGGDVIYAASGEQATLMQDRRVDMTLNSIFVRHRSIMQQADAIDLKLLPIAPETQTAVNERTGTGDFVIPGGSYDWAPDDTPTVTLGAALVVRADMDEQTAYNLTKALFENHDRIAGVHKAMNALTPEIMAAQTVVPYHAGARRYLSEAGLM